MTRFTGSGSGALVALGLGLGALLASPGVLRAQPDEGPETPAGTEAPAETEEAAPPAGTDDAPAGEGMREPPPPTADEQYDMKVRELEEKVVTLKEKIFRSKTRLLLLKERILNDVIAEAKLVIHHVNDMGGSFKPVQVYYRLDGEDLKLLDNATGLLDTDEPVEIFSGNVAPGNHNLTVEMVYRGDSALFSYLKDYLFKLRANYTFYATKGKITTVRSVGYLKGDITYDLTERPSIKFSVSQKSYTKEALDTPEGDEGEGRSE